MKYRIDFIDSARFHEVQLSTSISQHGIIPWFHPSPVLIKVGIFGGRPPMVSVRDIDMNSNKD